MNLPKQQSAVAPTSPDEAALARQGGLDRSTEDSPRLGSPRRGLNAYEIDWIDSAEATGRLDKLAEIAYKLLAVARARP